VPSSIIFQAGGGVTQAPGTNRYIAIGNGNNNSTFFTGSSVEVPWPFTCTFRNLYFTVEANTRTGITSGNLQLELYKNGAATGLTATFSAGATGTFSDTTNSVSVTAGDLLAWRVNGATGGSGTWTLGSMSVQLDHATDAPTTFLCYNAGGQLGTGYTPLASGTAGLRNTGTEANTTVDTIAGTFSYLTVSIGGNSRNGTQDIWLRKNGADTALTVQVPASTTGDFSDTSNTVTVADGDDVNYRLLRGGTTGTITADLTSVGFTADNDRFQVYGGGDAAFSPTASMDYYMALGGLLENSTTQAQAQQTWTLDDIEADRLEVNVSTNNITLDSYLYLQIDGVDTALEINITNEVTGKFTNVSDTVALTNGDLVNYHLYCDDSGDITIRSTAMAFTPTGGGGVTGDIAQTFFSLSQSASGFVGYAEEFNFRATSGYVTDGLKEIYVLGETSSQTRKGRTFQWDVCGDCSRDRSTSVGSRFAGVNKRSNDGTQNTWTLTLPVAGWYNIHAALGDATNTASPTYAYFYDDSTLIDSIVAVTASPTTANYYLDATGVTHANADWEANNTPILHEFVSTTFKLVIGSPTNTSGETRIAHLFIEKVDGPPSGDIVILRRRRM
jgi:hypothetical protein